MHVDPTRGVKTEDPAQQAGIALEQIDLLRDGRRDMGIVFVHRFDPIRPGFTDRSVGGSKARGSKESEA